MLAACGSDAPAAAPAPQIVEVIKEVPAEVVVEKEVPVEVVVEKEVPVVKLIEVEKGLPSIITDPDAIPGTFNEAPMLAELVRQGLPCGTQTTEDKPCPPVEERLPDEPAVIKPTDEIGKYGGTWRTGFTGPGDGQNIDRIQHNHLLFFDAKVQNVTPWILKGWEISEGGKTFTFFMRKGMRWSDGAPFTTEDVMFWYEDMYENDELVPAQAVWNEIGGVQGRLGKGGHPHLHGQVPAALQRVHSDNGLNNGLRPLDAGKRRYGCVFSQALHETVPPQVRGASEG